MKTLVLLMIVAVLCVFYVQEAGAWEDGDKAPTFKELKAAMEKHSEANSCKCETGECSCCVGVKVVGVKLNACAQVSYSDSKIKAALKLKGKTIASASFEESDDDYKTCGKYSGVKVCLSLVDVDKTPDSFSAKAKIKVKGFGSKKTDRFTINW